MALLRRRIPGTYRLHSTAHGRRVVSKVTVAESGPDCTVRTGWRYDYVCIPGECDLPSRGAVRVLCCLCALGWLAGLDSPGLGSPAAWR